MKGDIVYLRKKWIRTTAIFAMDVIAISIANFLALLIRYDMYFTDIPRKFIDAVGSIWVINLAVSILMFWIWRLYKSVWRYASATELVNICGSICFIFVFQLIYFKIFEVDLPRSYPFFYAFLLFVFISGIRFSYRLLRLINQKKTW